MTARRLRPYIAEVFRPFVWLGEIVCIEQIAQIPRNIDIFRSRWMTREIAQSTANRIRDGLAFNVDIDICGFTLGSEVDITPSGLNFVFCHARDVEDVTTIDRVIDEEQRIDDEIMDEISYAVVEISNKVKKKFGEELVASRVTIAAYDRRVNKLESDNRLLRSQIAYLENKGSGFYGLVMIAAAIHIGRIGMGRLRREMSDTELRFNFIELQ